MSIQMSTLQWYCSVVLQCNITLQYCSAILQCNIALQYYTAISLQYHCNTTAISLQYYTAISLQYHCNIATYKHTRMRCNIGLLPLVKVDGMKVSYIPTHILALEVGQQGVFCAPAAAQVLVINQLFGCLHEVEGNVNIEVVMARDDASITHTTTTPLHCNNHYYHKHQLYFKPGKDNYNHYHIGSTTDTSSTYHTPSPH